MQIAYKITADGKNITDLIVDRLLAAEITDQAGVKSDRLSLRLDDRDQRFEIPKRGAKIDVSLGYVGAALVKMGKYVVDEVEVSGPAREMVIRANAADMTGEIKAPKERSFDQITLGDLTNTIAGDNGLTPSISSELASRPLGHVDQTESDMQLMQRICADQGATCKVADGRLIVATHASGKTTGGSAMPKCTINAKDCADWSAVLADRGKYKSVKAYYHKISNAKRTGVTAGDGKPVLTLKNTYATEDEAKQAAQSKLKSGGRGASKVSISGLIGDPTMNAEKVPTLVGFRDGVDGDGWVINTVTHSFSNDGYTCNLDIEAKE